MKKFIKINCLVLIIFVLISITLSNTFATEDDGKIDELEQEKKGIESNIEQSNSQIEIVESELTGVLAEIEKINIEISTKNEQVDKLMIENKNLRLYIKNVQNDLDKISDDYKIKKETLDKRLVASYEMGKTTYLDVLLNSKGLISFLSNYYLISEMIKADDELIKECSRAQKYMQELEESLLEKNNRLEENQKTIQKEKISLENMEVLKNKRVMELSETEAELYKQIDEYHKQIDSIEKEIRALSLQNNNNENYIGGDMVWPVPGYTRITSPFGMRTHPITGIYKLHTGTDISAPMGATFIAANDGIVVKAEYNNAYGNMVIIDHGGGITTLYAHGSAILVDAGEYVNQGTPVLKVGSTGYSTGPHAHFEVRINGEYQDPLDYVNPNNQSTTKDNKNTESDIEEVVINN